MLLDTTTIAMVETGSKLNTKLMNYIPCEIELVAVPFVLRRLTLSCVDWPAGGPIEEPVEEI
jgi:hypothetical protein